jgi:hypothetical protein
VEGAIVLKARLDDANPLRQACGLPPPHKWGG